MADDNFNRDDEVLDPFLQSLFAEEAAAPLAEGSAARVMSGVLQGLAAAPVPTGIAPTSDTAATASTVSLGKTAIVGIVSLLMGVLIGIGVERTLLSETPVEPHPDAAIALEETLLKPILRPDAGLSLALPDAARIQKTQPPPRANPSSTQTTQPPAVEQETQPRAVEPQETQKEPEAHLIDRARVALRRGLRQEALVALMQHERRFPEGQLAEERDVLLIESYVSTGKAEIARRRIQRYRRQYPAGFHRKRVDKSEAQLPPAK